MLIVGSMKSLFFSSIDMAILAYRIARANGLYCVLDGKSIKFETEEDAELAEFILPSYHINAL